MIPHRILVFLAAISAAAMSVAQTTADEYFNQAARQYVKEDRLTALRTLDKGLRAYPQDPKLRKLAEELLKNEQQKQNQQQQEQKKQEQQKQQEKQEKQQQEQQQAEQQQEQQREEQGEQRQAEEREARSGDQQKPNGMSQRDAERMLDALERREQDVQQQVRAKLRPTRRARIEKDW